MKTKLQSIETLDRQIVIDTKQMTYACKHLVGTPIDLVKTQLLLSNKLIGEQKNEKFN